MRNSQNAENLGTGSCPPVDTRQHKGNGNGSTGISLIEPARVTTDFATLPDGTFLELVRPEDSAANALKFLARNGKSSSIVDRFEHRGRLITPPSLDAKAHGNLNLRLPTGISEATATASEIFARICDRLRDYIDLPEPSLCLVVAFALSTWLIDKLPVAPYLSITGPPESGKTTLLRWLHCLCRRAVLVAGRIDAAVYSLPALLRPTLLLDEVNFTATHKDQFFECWLRAGNVPGVLVPMGGQLVDAYGAKVLCSRRPVTDAALASRMLHIAMVPAKRRLELTCEQTLQVTASTFQPMLLMLRLLLYEQVDSLKVPVLSSFFPRMQDLQRALMVAFWEDRGNVPSLGPALSEQELDARVKKHTEPEGLIINALFAVCHEDGRSRLLVGHLAQRINTTRKSLREEADMTPRAVGAILKCLGLQTEVIGSFGRGLRLTTECRERIHDLFEVYRLQPSSRTIAGCSLCKKRFEETE